LPNRRAEHQAKPATDPTGCANSVPEVFARRLLPLKVLQRKNSPVSEPWLMMAYRVLLANLG
jgi:hypothetical protein